MQLTATTEPLMATLRTFNLTKSYGGRTVVRGVSLDVRSGEIVGLLGPNGAGKTTTFYMTVGLTAPESGRVELDGQDVTDDPMYRYDARVSLTEKLSSRSQLTFRTGGFYTDFVHKDVFIGGVPQRNLATFDAAGTFVHSVSRDLK